MFEKIICSVYGHDRIVKRLKGQEGWKSGVIRLLYQLGLFVFFISGTLILLVFNFAEMERTHNYLYAITVMVFWFVAVFWFIKSLEKEAGVKP